MTSGPADIHPALKPGPAEALVAGAINVASVTHPVSPTVTGAVVNARTVNPSGVNPLEKVRYTL